MKYLAPVLAGAMFLFVPSVVHAEQSFEQECIALGGKYSSSATDENRYLVCTFDARSRSSANAGELCKKYKGRVSQDGNYVKCKCREKPA